MLRVLYSSSMANAGTISYLKAIENKIGNVEKIDLDGRGKQELIILLEGLFKEGNVRRTLALQPLKNYQTDLVNLYLNLNKMYDIEGAVDYSDLRITMTAEAIINELGEVEGRNVVIVNRSDLLGKPLALRLMEMGATVTVAHSKTDKRYLNDKLSENDIVIIAIKHDERLLSEQSEQAKYQLWDKNETIVVDLSNSTSYKKAIRHVKTVEVLKERL